MAPGPHSGWPWPPLLWADPAPKLDFPQPSRELQGCRHSGGLWHYSCALGRTDPGWQEETGRPEQAGSRSWGHLHARLPNWAALPVTAPPPAFQAPLGPGLSLRPVGSECQPRAVAGGSLSLLPRSLKLCTVTRQQWEHLPGTDHAEPSSSHLVPVHLRVK